ncbi:MAG: endonuclease/exonuclease/phosphatase family protein [Treponema sp.]|nr:endonuclease/exonuclease/phosphatase family protein [Treponema sp.]
MCIKKSFLSFRFFLFFSVFISGFLFSCSYSDSDFSDGISVMNWNLETFFDGEFDGNEYKEFSSAKSGWSREKYKVRLERLASVIRSLDCDVIVMEELEKEGQLQDIVNQLSGTFDLSKVYRYGYFSNGESCSIGCGILSRLPLQNVSVHSLFVKGEIKQPSMRPIIKATFCVGGKNLDLFVNHWKSKSGGAESSEVWRDYQEKQLSRLIEESLAAGNAVLACGDFNRSIEEFEYKKNGDTNIALKGGANVHSPWFDEDGKLNSVGSYWYKNNWEYIDNFFFANASMTDFKIHDSGEWCDSENHPLRYKVYSGAGYSDHLPLTCRIMP